MSRLRSFLIAEYELKIVVKLTKSGIFRVVELYTSRVIERQIKGTLSTAEREPTFWLR